MASCAIDDCDALVKAKDLCAKHYMRLRRTGEPTVTRRPGRPPSAHRTYLRRLFPKDSMSARTFARYYRAEVLLIELGAGDDHKRAIAAATKPSGDFNVAEYERQATRVLGDYVDSRQCAESESKP